jgi:hypothetical protein
MAKTNYAFEKRQRDLAKKAKQEAKRQRKAGVTEGAASAHNRETPSPAAAAEGGSAPAGLSPVRDDAAGKENNGRS